MKKKESVAQENVLIALGISSSGEKIPFDFFQTQQKTAK
jgi:hypothetical protein